MRASVAAGVLITLLAAAVLLIGVEAVRGSSTHAVRIANPCLPRAPFAEGGLSGTVQQVVLAGLDHAACKLGVSREALVLAIGGSSAGGGKHLSRAQLNAAVRTGLLRSLDEAIQRGSVPAIARPFLENLIRTVSIDQLVRGGISIAGLFG